MKNLKLRIMVRLLWIREAALQLRVERMFTAQHRKKICEQRSIIKQKIKVAHASYDLEDWDAARIIDRGQFIRRPIKAIEFGELDDLDTRRDSTIWMGINGRLYRYSFNYHFERVFVFRLNGWDLSQFHIPLEESVSTDVMKNIDRISV